MEKNIDRIKDLELNILGCLLINSKLMEEIILEDKYFNKYQKMWTFMKSFYGRFKNYDISLMCKMASSEKLMLHQILFCLDYVPSVNSKMFKQYQEQLKLLYDEEKKERYKIDKIYSLANDLIVRQITVDEFDIKYQEMKDNVVEIFKEK